MQSESGSESLEALKDSFLRHYNQGDTEAILDLFYLEGASEQIINLYRRSFSNAEGLQIKSAKILKISPDRSTSDAHTLEPEKLLLLKFSLDSQGRLKKVEQFFYIGKHQNRHFFTLPAD